MRERASILLLAGATWTLRIALAWRGGQFYFPDEEHYFIAYTLLAQSPGLFRHLLAGAAFPASYDYVLTHPEHIGYAPIAMLADLVRIAAAWLVGLPDYKVIRPESPFWVSAGFLSVASVMVIVLTYALARRAGAGHGEGFLAAFLVGCSNPFFYYSRHVRPYDSAMALALLAMWVGLSPRPGPGRSFAVGLLASLAFVTYNGYWVGALVASTAHLAYRPGSTAAALSRAFPAAAGLAVPPALLSAATLARGAPPYLASLREFSQTVVQGDFAEGWSFPWEYLWQAEHGLLAVWFLGAVGVLALSGSASLPHRGRGLLWLGAALETYLLLVLGSTGLGAFVVYGRTARQLVPCLCLAAAAALASPLAGRRLKRQGGIALAGLALVQFLANAAPEFAQQFPGGVELAVAVRYGRVTRASTIEGCCPEYPTDAFYRKPSPAGEAAPYLLLNTSYLYPVMGAKPSPPGRELLAVPHPVSFPPYAYESYGPRERAILRSTDVRMRLLLKEPG